MVGVVSVYWTVVHLKSFWACEPVLGLRVLDSLVGLEYGIGLLVRVLPKTVLFRRCRACASLNSLNVSEHSPKVPKGQEPSAENGLWFGGGIPFRIDSSCRQRVP